MKKKRHIQTARVENPCTQEWSEMIGNDQVRFCTHCAKSVNNLSAMTRKDAMRLVRQSNGQLCIRYIKHPEKNAPVFGDQLIQISRRVPRVAAGVMSASLSLSTLAYAQGRASRTVPEPPAPAQIENPLPVVNGEAQAVKPSDDPDAFGSISGTVVDPQDAVVPAATVSLLDADGNQFLNTTTDAEGNYRIDHVPFNKYQLKASAPGFTAWTLDVNIREAKERTQNIRLDVGVAMGGAMVMTRVEYQGAIMKAVEDDDIDEVRSLIAAGEDVNRKEDDDTTPLFIAVERGNLEMVELLLDFGAKVNARNDERVTALMMVDEDASLELVELLLRKGANVDRVSESGDTALIRAAQNAKPEVLKALIDAGAELDAQNDEGRSALMNAADGGHIENVRVLLFAGADVNLRDKEDDNAWDHTSDDDIEDLLVSYGVVLDVDDVNVRNHDDEDEPEENEDEPDNN